MSTPDAASVRAGWRGVLIYCLLAYGLAWLVCLPLWLGGGLTNPLFGIVGIAMMFCPAIASVIVVRFIERQPLVGGLDLKPRASALRTLVFLALAIATIWLVVLLGLVVSAIWGGFQFDLVGMSAFRQLLEQQMEAAGQPTPDMPIRVLWLLQFVNVAVASVLNFIPAAGEEIGWRGYLFPRLRELVGPTGAVLLSGVIWGLWHAPLILLGYNYPANPGLGVLAMCVPCIGLGALLAWLSQRGGSVWPAALGHGAYNAAVGGFLVLFADADYTFDSFTDSVMGWASWPIWLIIVVVLLATRQLSRASRPASQAPQPASPIVP